MSEKEPVTQEDEEISKETLISLLKDKSKEIRTLTTKLQKLEEKYVKNYKEVKLMKKDHESLVQLLKIDILDKDPYLLPTLNIGEYEYDKLHELWNTREQDQSKITQNSLNELKKENEEIKQQYDKMLLETQENVRNATTNSNYTETIKRYENQLYELTENNSKLAEEVEELNQLLTDKSQTISQLRKIEESMQQQKAEMLLKELQNKSKLASSGSLENKIAQSEKLNEILKVKNELESALDKNRVLEISLETAKREIKLLQEKQNLYDVRAKGQECSTQTEECKEEISKEEEEQRVNQLKELSERKLIRQQSLNESISEVETQKEAINHEYLKNVILKYFIYSEGKAYNEASLLMAAIMTILNMSKEDREKVNIARQNATLWNSTKNFISSTFSFAGSEVNYIKK